MAIYTVTLQTLMQNGFNIGLQDYPIWDEAARKSLNAGIISHYYLREIGAETPQLFKFFLNRAMAEIMPYYNELWETTQYKVNPTQAINYSEIYEAIAEENENVIDIATAIAESTTTRTPNLQNKSLYSETPQNLLANGAIANEQYLTNARIDTSSGSESSQGNSSGKNNSESNRNRGNKNNYTRTRIGNEYHDIGELIKSYRETIINIELEIITHPKIGQCFMGVV